MESLTKNEARAIDFLIRNFKEKNSINELGKKLSISPRGIYKILKKLEKAKALIPERIGNAVYYRINLNEDPVLKLAEFVLMQNSLNPYAQIQAEDLKQLKGIAQSCILYGSVLTKGREARDIDVLIVLDKKHFTKVNDILDKIKSLKPKKVHEVMQTKEDIMNNIKKGDKVVLDIIRKGKVLWGAEIIVGAIKNSL